MMVTHIRIIILRAHLSSRTAIRVKAMMKKKRKMSKKSQTQVKKRQKIKKAKIRPK